MKLRFHRICNVCLLLLLALALVSCQNPLGDREYMEDLYIEIPDSANKLLIREWTYLLGSGAEVYWVSSDEEKTVLLGKLTGGDDGYCPFNDGKYNVSFAGDRVTFSWSFNGSDTYSKTESFTLPNNSDD